MTWVYGGDRGRTEGGTAYQAERTVCVQNKLVSRKTSGRTERMPVCLELRKVYIERKLCFLEKSHDILVIWNSSTSLK